MKDHTQRIQNVLDYIENHLFQPITDNEIVRTSELSPYHFHRIFTVVMGESLKAYIRKRRLSLAAEQIMKNQKPIIDLALDCGFESQESFTRAFKKMFAVTPGELKTKRIPDYCIKQPVNVKSLQTHLKGKNMEPQIVKRKAFRVIGLGESFSDNSFEAIAEFWNHFIARMDEIKNPIAKETFGMCLPNHPHVKKRDENHFVYIPCMPVEKTAPIPEGMVDLEVPANTYAVFTHKGPISLFPHTINYVWGTWMLENQNLRAEGPDFELYDERFQFEDPKTEIDIWIPIKENNLSS